MDAVRGAKVVGYIFIVLTLLGGLVLLPSLHSLDFNSIYVLATTIFSVIVAYWLIKTKLNGVYGMGILAILSVFDLIRVLANNRSLTFGNVGVVLLWGLLFFWFYSSKKKFSK